MYNAKSVDDYIHQMKEQGICPFYNASRSADKSDIIVMTYNYLFDPSILN